MKNKQWPQKWGLCVDWETTGATWGGDSSIDYQGVALGAVIFDTENFTEVESLYRQIKFEPNLYKWDDNAEKIHGLSREYLEQNGVSREEAAVDLIELIVKYFGTDSKVMIMGHNVTFDIRFTNQLLSAVEFEMSVEHFNKAFTHIPLHHVILDTSSLGFATMGLYKSDLLFEAMGLPERKDHNALEDARYTLATAKTIKDAFAAITGE